MFLQELEDVDWEVALPLELDQSLLGTEGQVAYQAVV